MLLFAHAGITLGAAAVIAGAVERREGKASVIASLSRFADIRLLLVGALLPDIIDKPVGQIFFRETFYNGRIFSHTLLFLIVLASIGFILYKARRQTWMLVLAFGVFTHLVLDGMWGVPGTLFWPFMGWQFKTIELTGWASGIFKGFVSDPSIYVSEAIGFVILTWYGIAVLKKKQAIRLLKTGRVG